MVFECALDELMKEIRGEKFTDVRSRKFHGEWLRCINENSCQPQRCQDNIISQDLEQYCSHTIMILDPCPCEGQQSSRVSEG